MSIRRTLLTVAVVLVPACSGEVSEPGGSASGVDGGAYPSVDANRVSPKCGATSMEIAPAHPNVLVVFDRSCSMRRRMDLPTEFSSGPTDPKGRWFVARQAVDQLTQAYQNRVRFGLMVFPPPAQGCGALPGAEVDPALMTHTAILKAIDLPDVVPFSLCTPLGSSSPGPQEHVTPTAEALTAAAGLPSLQDPSRQSFILLVTDGYATCGATASSLAQQVGALASGKVKTAVVGFGDAESAEAIVMLDAMAQAGGMAKPGASQKFWLAQSPTDLQSALKTVVPQTLTCRFTLSSSPPNKDKLYAFLDGQQVTESEWSYDAQSNAVTFSGAACQRIQQGQVKNVSVVFGCPDPQCVPGKEVCDGFDNDCDGEVDESCLE